MPQTPYSQSLDALNIPHYERIRLDLQANLIEQGWHPDQPIATEQVLAERYKVSIGTIRKAIECLVQDGLLYKVQGKGTFVKRPDFSGSLLRFFRYRDQSGQQHVPQSIIKSIRCTDPVPEINQKLALSETTPLIEIKRLRLVDGQVVLSEVIWLPEPLFSKLAQIHPKDFPNLLYPFYYDICNQFVLSATESLSFSSEHTDWDLQATQQGLLIKIERLAYNHRAVPIEYRLTYGLPQNFRYEVRIT